MSENIGKTIVLDPEGEKKIAVIDGENVDNFFTCHVGVLTDILVPKKNVIPYETGKYDFECVSTRQEFKKVEEEKSFELIKTLPFNCSYENHEIYVTVKKYTEKMKVVKTSKTSVFFQLPEGPIKYTNIRNIKKIFNYNPEQELPVKIVGKRGRKKKQIEAIDINNTTTDVKKPEKKKPVKQKAKKKTTKSKSNNSKFMVKDSIKPAPIGDKKYINEVPEEKDYRKEGIDIYMDLTDGRVGLKIRRSSGGRVFWDNPKTGQYSATKLKKVNEDENIKVYTIEPKD